MGETQPALSLKVLPLLIFRYLPRSSVPCAGFSSCREVTAGASPSLDLEADILGSQPCYSVSFYESTRTD